VHGSIGLETAVTGLVIILGVSVVVLFLSHRLRVSSIVGLVATGMLIGPSALGWIERESVELFAELGVVLLLFTVGLEVSLVRLRRNWRPFLLGGGGQVGLTVAATAGVATAFGLPGPQAVFLGFLAALSSTAIVLTAYTQRQELPSPQGMVTAGILLFQDFCLAPMLFLVPVLAGTTDTSTAQIVLRVALGLLVVVATFFAARVLMPRLLHLMVGTRTREVFLLGALAICLGMALVTSRLGFSLALGAFLAGLIISESEYSHQIVAEILPLRDVFNSLFFISVGMLLDLREVGHHLALVLALGAGLLLLKGTIAAVVTGWLGYGARVAVVVGLSVAQVGEFSLVLAQVGRSLELLEGAVFQIFLGAAILSMLVTPFLIETAPRLALRLPALPTPSLWRRTRLTAVETEAPAAEASGHVIVVGYGVNGSNVSRVLRSTGIPFVVLELNGGAVAEGQARGHPVVFGDATRAGILESHGITRARMLVVGIADHAATRRIVQVARTVNPALHILVRTRAVSEVDELRRLGADEVIPEEFETSIEITNRVLQQFHTPRNVIRAQRRILRDEGYGVFRAEGGDATPSPVRVAEILEEALTESYLVTRDSAAAGRSLGELNLRQASGGASVIAVVRHGRAHTSPAADLRLEPNDTLVLVGSHTALERAGEILSGPADPAAPPAPTA
jgi:CPA2 family monovalent cation:H+ antiporter-2